LPLSFQKVIPLIKKSLRSHLRVFSRYLRDLKILLKLHSSPETTVNLTIAGKHVASKFRLSNITLADSFARSSAFFAFARRNYTNQSSAINLEKTFSRAERQTKVRMNMETANDRCGPIRENGVREKVASRRKSKGRHSE